MIKYFYKRIIKKLNLSQEQLRTLSDKLIPENICSGPFFMENKMCPTTTALSLKLNQATFNDSNDIRQKFSMYGIGRFDLILLYVVFDIPAMISNRFFLYSLRQMKQAISELYIGFVKNN